MARIAQPPSPSTKRKPSLPSGASDRSAKFKEEVPAEGPFWSSQKANLLICILLAVATFSIYAPVATHPFINYDDGPYVVNNSHVNTGLNWQNVKWAFTAIESGNWHPLTWISHALDCQLFGAWAGGHHLTSLCLHVFNVILLFLLLYRATGAKGRSVVVAALFALHPFNVESVAWVAERKNLLCTLFFLLAIAAYGRYARRPGILRYLAVAALFALGLASKPMVVTLPFVLLLVDFWPLGRVRNWSTPSPAFPIPQASLSWLALEKLPLLGLSAASAVITIIAQRRFNAMPSASVWRLSWRIENAVNGYATYLEKAFFPRGLSPFYPNMTLGVWQVGLAASLLIALSVVIWKLRCGRPYIVIGFLWFLGTLVPVIGIIQVGAQSIADRYTYIPLIGIFVAVVWGISETARSKAVRIQWMVALSALALIVCPVVTWQQLTYWKSSVDLWTRALQVTPSNYVAEENLAVALADLGREDEALPHFEIARQIIPTDPTALLNVGTDYVKQGRLKEAIEAFEIVARTNHDPEHLTAAYRGLGIAYAQSGNRAKARENFILAQQISPLAPTEFYNLARLEAEEGAEKLAAVVSAYPTADNYLQLGQLLHLSGKDQDAEVAYDKALKIDPKSTEAKKALQDLKQTDKPPSPSNSFPSGPTGR